MKNYTINANALLKKLDKFHERMQTAHLIGIRKSGNSYIYHDILGTDPQVDIYLVATPATEVLSRFFKPTEIMSGILVRMRVQPESIKSVQYLEKEIGELKQMMYNFIRNVFDKFDQVDKIIVDTSKWSFKPVALRDIMIDLTKELGGKLSEKSQRLFSSNRFFIIHFPEI